MKGITLTSMLAFLTLFLSSCELVEGVFKAGIWTGLLIVAVVLFLIIFLIRRMGK
ncbi:phosphatidate cytidylyltransferase [Chitinophaga horti]|uniref:Phosphatidate cytidylyltransferase n=1 Tax=Chitinophaga horti TaxID=2920382 RepID=A0ABY6J936_9BACT|nr:phosphatidate cytidylyltransferase [Chitinophaga horti]UYQ94832.1 phosphatidate cytidylyltransferase [Chitinophaga horti]